MQVCIWEEREELGIQVGEMMSNTLGWMWPPRSKHILRSHLRPGLAGSWFRRMRRTSHGGRRKQTQSVDLEAKEAVTMCADAARQLRQRTLVSEGALGDSHRSNLATVYG